MTRVRIDLYISLDGYTSTADHSPENPMGEDWDRLTAAYAATRTFHERVLGDASGTGTTGIDDSYAAAYFEGIGAEIMGAGMFGLHSFPDDPDWKGWWGDEPPFGCPVYVLTHSAPRPPLAMAGRYDVPLPQRPDRGRARGSSQGRWRSGRAHRRRIQHRQRRFCAPGWSTTCTWRSPRSCSAGAIAYGTTCAGSTSLTR